VISEFSNWIKMSYRPVQSNVQTGGNAGFLLPPLAVIIVGLIVFGLLGQIKVSAVPPENSPAALQPEEPNQQQRPIAPLFTPEVQYWARKIGKWSQQWGVDANLVATVMQIESCGDPQARSNAGAMGLFQVMPFHFASEEDPYQPNTNAARGLAYLKSAFEARGGDIRLALAGYNAGIAGAKRAESAWPAETVRYVYWGVGIYEDARAGKWSSPTLEEWLAAGGASLCGQAASRLNDNP
jgi:hypothetical protein